MKTCFKCKIEKDASEFYGQPKMTAGVVGKCKQCTRKDVADNRAKKSLDPDWMAIERARHRVKSALARKMGRASQTKIETKLAWAKRNPEKRLAQSMVSGAIGRGEIKPIPCEVCGNPGSQAHHHDYTKPLDVWWLCSKHHGQAHHKDNPLVLAR